MGKIGLQISASLDDVAILSCKAEDFAWILKLQCTGCREISASWQQISADETLSVAGGHGSTNYAAKCKMCKKDIRIGILENAVSDYLGTDSETYKTVVAFECRGAEPIEYKFGDGWKVKTESDTVFTNVDLTEDDGDWTEWDEKLKKSVCINNSCYQFVKLK